MQTIFDQPHYLDLIQARGDFLQRILPDLKHALTLSSALDAGCGLGFFSALLQQDAFEVLGIDGRAVNIDEARKRYPAIPFELRDLEDSTACRLGSFDLVLCFGLLYHLENPLRAIRHLRALTSKVLLLETMCVPQQHPFALLRHEFHTDDQSLTDLAFYPSETCLVKMLYRAGFANVYRVLPPPDHDDFRENAIHHRRRIVVCAALEPLNLPSMVRIPEPAEAPDPWQKQISALRRLEPRVRKFLTKPLSGKIESLTFRLRCLLRKKNQRIRLPFGLQWLAQHSYLDNELRAGIFERREADFVSRFLREGMVVLDIGAHHGFYTLLASKRVGPSGKVFAFEPSPRERKRLRRHLRLNRCENVSIQPSALGSATGRADLFVVRSAENYLNSLRPPAAQLSTRKISVDVTTIDDFLRSAAVPRVDFIKLDVEGAELEVLRGANRLLRRDHRPTLLVEIQDVRTAPWGYRSIEIVRFLTRLDYQWLAFGATGALEPLDSERDVRDTNFLAVPRESLQQLLAAFSAPIHAATPAEPCAAPAPLVLR